MIANNINNMVKIMIVLCFVNLIILTTNVETYIVPTITSDKNNVNNIIDPNCITNCSEKHQICAKWCRKVVENDYENENIDEKPAPFALINAPDMCPAGQSIDKRGRCRSIVS